MVVRNREIVVPRKPADEAVKFANPLCVVGHLDLPCSILDHGWASTLSPHSRTGELAHSARRRYHFRFFFFAAGLAFAFALTSALPAGERGVRGSFSRTLSKRLLKFMNFVISTGNGEVN